MVPVSLPRVVRKRPAAMSPRVNVVAIAVLPGAAGNRAS